MANHGRELVENNADVGDDAAEAVKERHSCTISKETLSQGIRSYINVSPSLFSSHLCGKL